MKLYVVNSLIYVLAFSSEEAVQVAELPNARVSFVATPLDSCGSEPRVINAHKAAKMVEDVLKRASELGKGA